MSIAMEKISNIWNCRKIKLDAFSSQKTQEMDSHGNRQKKKVTTKRVQNVILRYWLSSYYSNDEKTCHLGGIQNVIHQKSCTCQCAGILLWLCYPPPLSRWPPGPWLIRESSTTSFEIHFAPYTVHIVILDILPKRPILLCHWLVEHLI